MSTRPQVPAIAPVGDIPAFMSKIGQIHQQVDAPDPNVNAFVRPMSHTVHVTGDYSAGTPQHEYEHVYENAVRPLAETLLSGGNGAEQEYGGTQGLVDRRAHGQTIASMNPEQRAQMVGDAWNTQHQVQGAAEHGLATPQGLQAYDQSQAAAHPFLRQLKNLGDQGIDTHPEAPGLPPSAVSGILTPDPLMGGQWTQVPPLVEGRRHGR